MSNGLNDEMIAGKMPEKRGKNEENEEAARVAGSRTERKMQDIRLGKDIGQDSKTEKMFIPHNRNRNLKNQEIR